MKIETANYISNIVSEIKDCKEELAKEQDILNLFVKTAADAKSKFVENFTNQDEWTERKKEKMRAMCTQSEFRQQYHNLYEFSDMYRLICAMLPYFSVDETIRKATKLIDSHKEHIKELENYIEIYL